METREAELMRKRKQMNRLGSFNLSHDPTAAAASSRWALRRGAATATAHKRALQWEPVNFRGVDQSIADLSVTGFGSRTLLYGEGPVVRSPADVARLAPDAAGVVTVSSAADVAVLAPQRRKPWKSP